MQRSRTCADIDRLRRAQRDQIAAAEIDAEIPVAAHVKRRRARNDQGEREHAGEEAFAEEVDVLRRDQVQHRDLFHPAGIDEPAEEIPPDDERREERGQDAERKRNRETFDRPARFPEQNRRRDQGRDVGVEDRAERLFVGGLDRDLERFPERQFFPQSLVNQNARIDREADRQDNARNARQGEDEVEHRKRAHQQDDVHDQREVRDQAGELIVDQHANQRDREADETGDNAARESNPVRGWARRCVLLRC